MEIIDSIIERLQNYCKPNCNGICSNCKFPNAVDIVRQVAEEQKEKE